MTMLVSSRKLNLLDIGWPATPPATWATLLPHANISRRCCDAPVGHGSTVLARTTTSRSAVTIEAVTVILATADLLAIPVPHLQELFEGVLVDQCFEWEGRPTDF